MGKMLTKIIRNAKNLWYSRHSLQHRRMLRQLENAMECIERGRVDCGVFWVVGIDQARPRVTIFCQLLVQAVGQQTHSDEMMFGRSEELEQDKEEEEEAQ